MEGDSSVLRNMEDDGNASIIPRKVWRFVCAGTRQFDFQPHTLCFLASFRRIFIMV